jgi:hypothetical protein
VEVVYADPSRSVAVGERASELARSLSRVEELFEQGDEKRARQELGFAEALARGDADALPAMLALVTAFAARSSLGAELAELIGLLRQEISATTGAVSRTEYALWLSALAAVGLVIFIFYVLTASPLFPDCGEGLSGRAADGSLATAAGLGGALGLVAGFSGWRFRRRRGLVLGAFTALYVIGLVVLWNVSPLIWGHTYCA